MLRACQSALVFVVASAPAAALAEGGVEVTELQAVAGEPLGAASVTFRFDAPLEYKPDQANFRIASEDGRVLYPAFTTEGSQLSTGSTLRLTELSADFLFTGAEPFTVTFRTRDGREQDVELRPAADAAKYKAARARWWSRYGGAVRERAFDGGYPPQVENYLVAMLSRRMDLEPPTIHMPWSGWSEIDNLLGLFLGAESIRASMQRDVFLRNTLRREAADQPLPAAVAPPPVEAPNVPEGVEVESIAAHVPAECFYVRFGHFQNFVWLRDRIEQWGGSLRDLVSVRGVDYGIGEKLQRQLALRESVLSRTLGQTLISDVALVGTDPFLREGPSVGVLFEARNSALLRQRLESLRREAAKANPDAVDRTVVIDGHKVSSLATPDNRIRSFYAVDGDYHLVTTSRHIVQRFFEAGAGDDALAGLDEFRFARHLMPAKNDYRAFVYFSDPFFRNIVGPAYRVEMTRRTQALAEIELVHLARLAARAEGRPDDSIDVLVEGGFLPDDFPTRPDGSRTLLENGAVRDSLRGAHGSFLPVADVEVKGVTPSEAQAYQQFSLAYRGEWERMDPVIIGVSHEDLAKGRERVVLDVHITPYAKRHYGMIAGFLSPPEQASIAPVPDDLVSIQARLGGWLAQEGGLFYAGLRDSAPRFTIEGGRVQPSIEFDAEPHWYFGTTREHPWLPPADTEPDKDGYVNREETWREWQREHGGFRTYARRRETLEKVTPHLKIEEAERAAQLRLRIGELAESQAAPLLNAGGYVQARKTSAANARFLHALSEQLNVPDEKALSQAQTILGGQLLCALGGEYELTDDEDLPAWHSTAWTEPSLFDVESAPRDYRFPLLDWIRGLNVEFNIDATTLTTRIELELQNSGARD